ncbi:MAG: hypothetical protein NZ893_01615, partial [Candidatus Aenigmarchaeota archaeon]|nr:hypothetical protein [Candidatus Aenigmarchaeota archaeon]
MKGISAVIATLLLLVITIGLAATAYFYINNIMQRSTAKVVSVEPGNCFGTNPFTITFIITNIGTENIVSGDIRVVLNNNPNTPVSFNPNLPLAPRGTTVASITST